MLEPKFDYSLLYKNIFKRKSIRRYEMTPLDDTLLAEISAYIEKLTPMYAGAKLEFKIVTNEQVESGRQPAAPYYVAIFSEKTAENLLNIGFVIQLLSLYLTGRGLGSCWLGIPKPTAELVKSSQSEFVIFLSFGYTKDSIYRTDISEFNRYAIEAITDSKDLMDLLEPVRLAPSAVNFQPWFFTGTNNLIHVYCNSQSEFQGFQIAKFNLIDIGIALSHLWLAIKQTGRTVVFLKDTSAEQKKLENYYYVISLRIE